MLMANKIKIIGRIVGIILLVLGLISIILGIPAMLDLGYLWVFGFMPFMGGIFLVVIGLCILIPSMKKNSKSLDKSITK